MIAGAEATPSAGVAARATTDARTDTPVELIRALAALTDTPENAPAGLSVLLGFGVASSRTEHTQLFVFELPPYASIYLGEDGWIGGQAREIIAGFWRAVGRKPPREPDHLAVLLGLYAELVQEEAGGGAHARMARQARRALIAEHLSPWLFPYLDAVAAASDSPVHRAWAATLGDVIAAEMRRLSVEGGGSELDGTGASIHLRLTRPVEAANQEFLRSVLAPIRSGAILTKRDFRRFARESGLGLRAGERRYMLRNLLAQERTAVLNWLRDHHMRAAEGHEVRGRTGSAAGAAAELARRARHTARTLRDLARQRDGSA